MPRKCKTPKLLVEAIAIHSRAVEQVEEMIRVKHTVPVENQAAHIQEGHDALWIARLEGQALMLEAMLFEAKCYAGYGVFGPKKPVRDNNGAISGWARESLACNNPDYADWRRLYFTRT